MKLFSGMLVATEEGVEATESHHWLWPEGYEIAFGGIASIIIFALLFWKVGPLVKKAMAARTQRVQDELDTAAADQSDADAEAQQILAAKGDIGAERSRLLADADTRAEALVVEGRARLDQEIAELHAKADADMAAVMNRGSDELRAEIARLASEAAEQLVTGGLDEAAHQDLIESFIQRVGASS